MNTTTTTTHTPTVTVVSKKQRSWGYYDTYSGRFVNHRRGSERPDGRSIAYLDFQGETILDNLVNRRTRPYTLLRPYVLEALDAAGISVDKMRWSQTAGCSCPCSPGYVLYGAPRGYDIWVEVS